MPLVSVLMPVYNTPVNYLKEAVSSVLRQTWTDFEFIIIDDGSTGETEEYLILCELRTNNIQHHSFS